MVMCQITMSALQHLPWVAAGVGLVALATLAFGRRHGRPRFVALGLRLLVLVALGAVLLGPVISADTESRFEPSGLWRLAIGGAALPPADARDFDGPPAEFVNQLRDSLVIGAPPARVEVHGLSLESTKTVRDAVLALGVPCKAVYPPAAGPDQPPVLSGIRAPLAVRPGEAFTIEFGVAGAGGTLTATLDGESLPLTDGQAEVRLEHAGAHVIEARLTDANGTELQRAGHVIRVGDAPRLLAIGLPPEQFKQAQKLARDIQFENVSVETFSGARLRVGDSWIELALASVDALNRLSDDQAAALAMFVARGGGLFVTGDGAKYVTPDYLPRDVRNLLPVMLLKEGKKPPPDDPPVKEEIVKAEIAKVSMCFVLDRSYSMNLPIGRSGKTRWQVATKGVVESLNLVDQGGRRDAEDKASEAYATRIGVMTFNLQQQWVYAMAPAFKHNRNWIGKELERTGTSLLQVNNDDFDAQGYNTDIYAAMKAAVETMKEEKSAVKVIVMLTDGADRAANTLAGLKHANLRDAAMAHDINIITIGIGAEFDSSTTKGEAARKVVEELATRPEFINIASDEASAAKANVIFVDSVETAFQAYDDKKNREEEDRKRALEENKEEPKVDVMPGTFPLVLSTAGEQLFGANALPDPAPKLAWVARSRAREGSAVPLAAATDEPGATPVLALRAYGLGRVAFWGAGTQPESLGELTGWAEFPGLFAGSLRWLMPREEPDLRLIGAATPEGVRILDPLAGATYSLRTGDSELPLTLDHGVLRGMAALPAGPAQIIETLDTDSRVLGDVYVAAVPPYAGRTEPMDAVGATPTLDARPPEVTAFTSEATTHILYLVTLALLVLPLERLVRRRT